MFALKPSRSSHQLLQNALQGSTKAQQVSAQGSVSLPTLTAQGSTALPALIILGSASVPASFWSELSFCRSLDRSAESLCFKKAPQACRALVTSRSKPSRAAPTSVSELPALVLTLGLAAMLTRLCCADFGYYVEAPLLLQHNFRLCLCQCSIAAAASAAAGNERMASSIQQAACPKARWIMLPCCHAQPCTTHLSYLLYVSFIFSPALLGAGKLQHQQNMLQDYVRTATYQQAILENAADFRGKLVMDVGAGTGILSLFAAQVTAWQ